MALRSLSRFLISPDESVYLGRAAHSKSTINHVYCPNVTSLCLEVVTVFSHEICAQKQMSHKSIECLLPIHFYRMSPKCQAHSVPLAPQARTDTSSMDKRSVGQVFGKWCQGHFLERGSMFCLPFMKWSPKIMMDANNCVFVAGAATSMSLPLLCWLGARRGRLPRRQSNL